MATLATTYLKGATKWAMKRIANLRNNKGDVANGVFLLTGYKDVVAADYDVAGDIIELFQFPASTYLLGCSITANKEYDTGGSGLRTDLILSDLTSNSFTTGAGLAFANQPANDTVSVHSTDAGDTTQTVTIIGTTTATDTVVVEDVALDGTNVVDTVKTDWGQILAVIIDASCDGTVTVEEKSAGANIVQLTTGQLSKGVETVTDTDAFGRLIDIVCSGSGTKQIGLRGTDNDGTVIYDSQALAGTGLVQSNLSFTTLTHVYTGDLEATRTVTVTTSEQPLVQASQAFTSLAVPLNYNGASIDGSEFGMDVGGEVLALRIAVAPTTANSGTVRFSYKVLVYHGVASTVVP